MSTKTMDEEGTHNKKKKKIRKETQKASFKDNAYEFVRSGRRRKATGVYVFFRVSRCTSNRQIFYVPSFY